MNHFILTKFLARLRKTLQSQRQWWRKYHWAVSAVLAAVALVLGYTGFAQHFAAQGIYPSSWDILYLDIQLFVLQSGAVEPPMGWDLNVARFLAPFVTVYTAFCALALVFSEQLRSLRLQFVRNHVVVCGLGEKGLLLAKGFLESGEQVVLVEQDERNGMVEQCRERGAAKILFGRANDPALLERAGVERARYVVAVSGSDDVNAEVALLARQMIAGRRSQALTCLVHIADVHLFYSIREKTLASPEAGRFRLEFFNIYDSAARRLLNAYPLFSETSVAAASEPHLLLVGSGLIVESIVVHAGNAWRRRAHAKGKRLRITVFGRDAESRIALWQLRYAYLARTCEFSAQTIGSEGWEFHEAQFPSDVTMTFVCPEEDSTGLCAALAIQRKFGRARVPIVLCAKEEGSLTRLLSEDAQSDMRGIRVFGLFGRTCDPDLLPGGVHETLARQWHEEYRREKAALGQTAAGNPALVPWDQLDEEFRESSRLAADHISVKLEAVGCTIGPLMDWDAESFAFRTEEVEQMARLEHERWMNERLLAGWTYGATRDDAAKRNPNLVPWDQLAEEEKQHNRASIKKLPGFLAGAGFQICRVK